MLTCLFFFLRFVVVEPLPLPEDFIDEPALEQFVEPLPLPVPPMQPILPNERLGVDADGMTILERVDDVDLSELVELSEGVVEAKENGIFF